MNKVEGYKLLTEMIRIKTGFESLVAVTELLLDAYETKENQQTITLFLYLYYNQLNMGCTDLQQLIDFIDK